MFQNFSNFSTNQPNFSIADDKPALYSLKIDSQSHFSFGCSVTLTSSSGQLSLSLPSSRLLRLMTASPSFTLERLQNNNKNQFTLYICNARPHSAINSFILENYIRQPDPSTDKWTMNINIKIPICTWMQLKPMHWSIKNIIIWEVLLPYWQVTEILFVTGNWKWVDEWHQNKV